jgi:periplasmic protein TonB
MSYLNHAQDPRRRATALTGTVAIHLVLGFVVVTGLAFTGAGPVEDPWDPFTITPDKPPPPPPEPQKQSDPISSVVTAPKPPVDLTRTDPPLVVDDRPTDTEITYVPERPIAQPDPPRPVASFVPRVARPSNDPHRWITTNDYEPNWLRRELEGTAGYRVVVGTNGRVSSCEIVRPSGEGPLDTATCRYITQRARFEPATDDTGGKVVGTYTGTVRWEIPD